ncbi:putative uncharacterized protein [Bacteroides sp. CAG:754]|nr:putative uncharacterized protein [Bacteroides sp. CAG:754]
MSNCDRTTILNLFSKTGDNGTVTTQYITKAGSDEFGVTFHFSLTDGTSQTLYIDLRQTFGASHYIGRIHGFIGRDHDHFFRTILHSHISYLTGTCDIDQYGFARILFHQWDMLVSSGMKDDLRMVIFKYHTYAFFHTHITNHRNKIYSRIILFKFKTDIMQRSLGRVKHDEFLNTHLYKLTAKFTTDTTCRTGYQHNFSPELFSDLTKIDIYFSTTQQVFNLNGTYPLMEITVGIRLTDSGSNQSFKSIAFTILQKTVFLQTGILITGKQNTLNTTLTYYIVNIRFIFKIINRKIRQVATAVVFAIDIKACNLIMCTVTETQLQGHTLLINTINKDTCILLIHPIQQKIVSDDK